MLQIEYLLKESFSESPSDLSTCQNKITTPNLKQNLLKIELVYLIYSDYYLPQLVAYETVTLKSYF